MPHRLMATSAGQSRRRTRWPGTTQEIAQNMQALPHTLSEARAGPSRAPLLMATLHTGLISPNKQAAARAARWPLTFSRRMSVLHAVGIKTIVAVVTTVVMNTAAHSKRLLPTPGTGKLALPQQHTQPRQANPQCNSYFRPE